MKFFAQLFNAAHAESRGDVLLFLIFETLVLYQVIFFVWRWAFYIPRLDHVVAPAGIAYYVNISFMFKGPYAIINASFITLFMFLGYFKRGRFFYLLALLGMHLQYAARFSQGKISHGAEFTGMALLVLALAALLFGNKEERRKITIGLFIFFMALGYTSAAFCKLIAAGPHWADGGHLILWMKERATDLLSQNGSFSFNWLQQLILHVHWLATIMLTVGLLTELCSFLLCWRKTRWIEATLLIGMHIGIVFTMNISFTYFLTFLIVLGYPWPRLFDYWLQKRRVRIVNHYLERMRLAS